MVTQLRSKEAGFSLLELSVAVGVAAIVASAGIVATTTFINDSADKRDGYVSNAETSIENAESSSLALGLTPIVPSTDKNVTTNFSAQAGETVLESSVTIAASGLKPGAEYTVLLQSDPVVLATGTVPENGILNEVVTIPLGTPSGWHSITLTTTYYDDAPLSDSQWFEIASNGTLSQTSENEPVPGSVVDFYAVSTTYNSADMVWSAPFDGGEVDYYEIVANNQTFKSLQPSINSYTVTGLPSNTIVPVTIRAVNSGGSSEVTSNVTTQERILLAGWGTNSWSRITGGSIYDNLVEITAGSFHSAGLLSDGTVVAWGSTQHGQSIVPLGDNDLPITGKAISAGSNHTWVVREDGTVTVWGESKNGSNFEGQTDIVDIAAGGNHAIGIKSNGTVVSMGGASHQLSLLVPPSGLNNVVKVSASDSSNLALKSDGTLVAWGSNNCGQNNIPAGLNNVIDIASGNCFHVAVKSDGTVVVWGHKYDTDSFAGDTNVPAGLSNVIAVDASMVNIVALKSDGTVVGWGNDYAGQTTPTPGTQNVTKIAAGDYHTLVLKVE